VVILGVGQCIEVVASEQWVSKVEWPDGEWGCTRWSAAKTDGYGVLRIGKAPGILRRAHLIAWTATYGDIPPGFQVDHLCRIRECVNTHHLDPVPAWVNNMRSESTAAKNAIKTHCLNGHLLNPENLHPGALKRGRRTCVICQQARHKERNRLINEAMTVTGLSQDEYAARYGWSKGMALKLIEGRDV